MAPHTDRQRQIIFTLDLEDHLGSYGPKARFAANAAMILDLLDTLQIAGTFFVVGRIAETHPGLVRDVASRGHEIACHGYDHTTLDKETRASFATKLIKAKDILEQVGGRKVLGFRAPVFSLSRKTDWVPDILREAGFEYSSSILPAPNPLHSFVDAPRVPFRWASGLLEFPTPVAPFLGASLPFLGGVYFRYLPWRAIRSAIARMSAGAVPWIYLHPYDFDTTEPFGRMPETSWLTNVICWLNRGSTASRLTRLFAERSSGRFCDILESGTLVFQSWQPNAARQ